MVLIELEAFEVAFEDREEAIEGEGANTGELDPSIVIFLFFGSDGLTSGSGSLRIECERGKGKPGGKACQVRMNQTSELSGLSGDRSGKVWI